VDALTKNLDETISNKKNSGMCYFYVPCLNEIWLTCLVIEGCVGMFVDNDDRWGFLSVMPHISVCSLSFDNLTWSNYFFPINSSKEAVWFLNWLINFTVSNTLTPTSHFMSIFSIGHAFSFFPSFVSTKPISIAYWSHSIVSVALIVVL
jgi:hypothetical protein